MNLIGLILSLLLLGLVAWGVRSAPFIEETFKTFIVYVLIVVGAILAFLFIVHLFGGNPNALLFTK